jgi:hypothetical protein
MDFNLLTYSFVSYGEFILGVFFVMMLRLRNYLVDFV